MIKGFLKKFAELLVHLAALSLVIWVWWGVAKWYVNHVPVLGVDFFNTVTYTSYFAKNFVPPVYGWNYVWWSGYPIDFDYPAMHMHLMSVFAQKFPVIDTVVWYMMTTVLIYLVFGYLTFWQLSKNFGLALMLSVLGTMCVSLYGALAWGGSLPFFASQMFLPIVMYLVVKFVNTANKRYLALGAMFLGISAWGHQQVAIIYILPVACVTLLFSLEKGMQKSLKYTFLFGVVFLIIAYPKLYGRFLPDLPMLPFWGIARMVGVLEKTIDKKTEVTSDAGPLQYTDKQLEDQRKYTSDLKQWHRNNINQIWDKNHPYLWYSLFFASVVYLLSVVFLPDRIKTLASSGAIVAGGFYALFIIALIMGFSIPTGGWYRVYWPLPFIVGMVASAMWGSAVGKGPKWFNYVFGAIVGITCVFMSVWGWRMVNDKFYIKLDDKKLAYSEDSSAWPILVNYLVGDKHKGFMEKLLVPSWIDPNERNHRLYAADAQVNIWWNSKFKMPIQRGYIDPPIGNDRKGGFFWWDVVATNDQLVKIFDTPEQVARNNAYFLANWFGVKYLELGHASSSFSSLSSYLKGADFIKREEELFFVDNPKLIKYFLGSGDLDIKYVPFSSSNKLDYKTRSLGLGEFLVSGENISRIEFVSENPDRYKVHGTDGREWKPMALPGTLGGMYLDIAELSGGKFDLVFKYLGLQSLHYYELNDEIVSPLLHPTDSGVLAIVGEDNYYESAFRALGMENLNSKFVLPLKKKELVENISQSDLQRFDMVFLYGYKSKSNNWNQLSNWVKNGGKVWIETGGDVYHTGTKDLPDLFPIVSTSKQNLGTKWQTSNKESNYLNGVDVQSFSDLVIDGQPWYLSVAEGIKSGSKVVIEQSGKPVMVEWSYGKGKVVWSGLNLPYHILVHNNSYEGRLFANVFRQEMDLKNSELDGGYKVNWINPQKTEITINRPVKGVLFREQQYGWVAKLGGGGNLPVYKTGPTYNGYVYVPTQHLKAPFKIEFSVWPIGYRMLAYHILSWVGIAVVLDYAILKSVLFGWVVKPVWNRINRGVSGWWDKKEE